jgi:hypothetical protein
MDRPTVGKLIYDAAQRPQYEAEVGEIINDELNRYIVVLTEKVVQGKKKFEGKNFYIEICLKRERLMPSILPRIYGHARQTCPTPNNDQDVWFYIPSQEQLQYVWSIPCPSGCIDLKSRALNIRPEERQLLKFVYDYEDGTLFRLMKKLNNEEDNSPLLKKD